MYYSMSRLSVMDVKWTDLLDAHTNSSFFGKHYNPYYELIVVADGTVNLETGNDKLILQAGDSLLLAPWEQHNGWKSEQRQGKFYWAQFSCAPGMDIFSINRLSELNIMHAKRTELRTVDIGHEDLLVIPRYYRNRQIYKLLSRFEELAETMKQPRGYFRYRSTLLIADMLGLIANDFLEQHHKDQAFPTSYFAFHKLVNFLNNFYESDITSAKLEQSMDYNYEYLCQVFKKYTGGTISRYIQQLRVQRAKHLLRNTESSIQEISQEVGYSDPFYFSRLFKKIEGVSPQHYRNFNQASLSGKKSE